MVNFFDDGCWTLAAGFQSLKSNRASLFNCLPCWLIQLLLQLGTNRFVDRGLGDLPDERAHDREDCEINRRQAERVFDATRTEPTTADHYCHGERSENSGVHTTHKPSLACRQTCRSSASLNHTGAPVLCRTISTPVGVELESFFN